MAHDRLMDAIEAMGSILNRASRCGCTSLVVLFLLGSVGPAMAGIPYEKTIICPIDGKEFTIESTLSISIMNRRLDTKPMTSAPWMKWPPICPDSGFPVYRKDFSEEELEALRATVLSDEFVRARDANVPSYMMYIVKKELGADDFELGYALLVAVWDAEEQSGDLYRRYIRLSIEHFEAFLADHDERDEQWWTAQVLNANFHRRLGNFDQAIGRLELLPVETLAENHEARLYIERIVHFARIGDMDAQWLE